LEVRNTVYDKWEPRVLAKDAFGQCTFSESIKCNGTVALIDSVYIQATVEHFNLNSTDAIHLARAYENAGQSDKALSIYRALSGFFPKYRTAVINMDMGAFLAVYHEFPHRKEPLYYLARHYRTLGNYSECLLYARAGMLIGSPVATDTFIEKPIYGYGLELEFAHCLYYAGRPMEAVNQWKRVLPSMPTKLASELTANLGSILGNQ
jgi:tetratricopeptide (TPR) repeat protein